jgi:hypothetical protein
MKFKEQRTRLLLTKKNVDRQQSLQHLKRRREQVVRKTKRKKKRKRKRRNLLFNKRRS